jgi:hypothetical protein
MVGFGFIGVKSPGCATRVLVDIINHNMQAYFNHSYECLPCSCRTNSLTTGAENISTFVTSKIKSIVKTIVTLYPRSQGMKTYIQPQAQTSNCEQGAQIGK